MSFDGPIDFPNPIQIPQIFEKLIAAGNECPGICQLSGFARSWDWDVKKAKGSSGASTTLQGEDLAEGSIEFFLWLPEHWGQWVDWRELLTRGLKQKKIEALDVLHPYLQDLEIFSLVVKKIGIVTHKGRGLYSITVEFQEFRQPKAAGGSPSGSVGQQWKGGPGASGPKTPPTAQSQQDQEIDQLLKEAQAA